MPINKTKQVLKYNVIFGKMQTEEFLKIGKKSVDKDCQ